MGYESMLQPVSLTAETRSASLNRHPATRRLFFEPDAPVQLGPEQLPTTALQLQVKPRCHMQALVIIKWGSSAVSCAPIHTRVMLSHALVSASESRPPPHPGRRWRC